MEVVISKGLTAPIKAVFLFILKNLDNTTLVLGQEIGQCPI